MTATQRRAGGSHIPQRAAGSNAVAPGLVLVGGFLVLQTMIFLPSSWGVLGLNLYIIVLFYLVRPPRILHPSTMIFAYYGLWVVVPSTLDFIFESIDWEWVLPVGRPFDWSSLSPTTLLQIQLSVTTLSVMTRLASRDPKAKSLSQNSGTALRSQIRHIKPALPLVVLAFAIAVVFMQATGGFAAWIADYSTTFLTKRRGLGALNFILIGVGTLTCYVLGLKFHLQRAWPVLAQAVACILVLGFVGGFKSRVIILALTFALPSLIDKKAEPLRLIRYLLAFFVILYALTLVRSNGYYSGFSRYLEMILGYFNSYPLHDLIVNSRDPELLSTSHFILTKPGQALGIVGPDAEFEISVMLTKEYFPAQWYARSATQQWPIETEMYLNFLGPILQVFPLALYGMFLGKLYRHAILGSNPLLLPIYLLEFIRILTVLRGVLIPWQMPIFIIQYFGMYVALKWWISSTSRGSETTDSTSHEPARVLV